MHKIALSKQVIRFVRELQAKQYKQVVGKILSLATDPMPADSESLTGYDHYRRTSVGEYRIVYQIAGDNLIIAIVDKRNDDEVYKQLARK